MKKKKQAIPNSIVNRRASFDYELKNDYVAGIVLSGAEVKNLRRGHGSLRGSFVTIKDGEAWLNNMQITPDVSTKIYLPESEQSRVRKLLLSKKQLEELAEARNNGYTIVPTKALISGRFIKIVIAVAKGKKQFDKRQKIKSKEEQRTIQRTAKYNVLR